MNNTPRSSLYPVLLLALVASVALLSMSAADRLAGYFAQAAAVEVRHGTLGGTPLSVVIASAAKYRDPAVIAADRYFERAGSALVVFEGDLPLGVLVSGADVDLVWLDAGLSVRASNEGTRDGEQRIPPPRATFLLVLPDGYADRVELRAGERLQIL